MSPNTALRAYRKMDVESGVSSATPKQLIQMLLRGALGRIAQAKGHMERGEVAKKGEAIGWGISIIDGLRASLNHEIGGEISTNLDRLYEYMSHQLLQANLNDDPELLDEVAALLQQIKEAWDSIPEDPVQARRLRQAAGQ